MDETHTQSCTVWEVQRTHLVDILQQSKKKKIEDQFVYLQDYIMQRTQCPEAQLSILKRKLANFKNNYKNIKKKKEKFKASRKRTQFNKDNKNWLECVLKFENANISKRGRPTRQFIESSERTKRRRTKSLREEVSVKELAYATQMSLRASGQAQAASVVKDVALTSSPKRASKYRKAYLNSRKEQEQQLFPDEALSMIVEGKLTRHQYNIVRSKDKNKFPCYSYVQKAKQKCYPSKDSIQVSSMHAQVKLQALLDHTIGRILEVQEVVIDTLDDETIQNLRLVSKWGMDGSSAIEYKQKFDSDEDSDAAIFMTSLVPIQLLSVDNKKIIWQNPRPSSTRYCRPIKFCYQRETTDITVEEEHRVQKEIAALQPTVIIIKGRQCTINHRLLLTMIDGKICNAITETKSTQRCYICNLTSKDFNNLNKVLSTPVDEKNLKFGLSVLHGWIRFMECLLHIAYKLPIKKWQARKENKNIVASNKKLIQEKFKTDLGLIIDQPRQAFGNSNDGNTARRFFENAQISSTITGIDKEVIIRFHRILQTISSGYEINNEIFKKYCLETAKQYIKKYMWYPMSPTVHKILIHGPIVIAQALLPIGQLSEEAQEARNKDFRNYRRGFSRKTSRVDTNKDVLNNLLISSDPYIASFRQLPQKKLKSFPKEVIEMLKPNNFQENVNSNETESICSSDSDSDI